MNEGDSPQAQAQQAPRVTVITATYNLMTNGRADYFRQCVESVHAQTHSNIEHLVIDGASTDGTLDLARKYEAKGWLCVYSEPDKGIYDAFNKGIRHATGKYIAFLNSDDWWHDARGLEQSVELLEASGADFSYAPNHTVDEGGNLLNTYDVPVSSFFYQGPFCHQTMICRTESLREIGLFDTHFRILADYDAMVRLFMQGVSYVRVPLCFTSFREGGISNDSAHHAAYMREFKEVYRRQYGTLIGEAEIERLNQRLLPDALKKLFAQKLHPALYAELNQRCLWDEEANAWHYHVGKRTSLGPLGLAQIMMLGRLKHSIVTSLKRLVSRH